jgi:two-component system, response regulator PdtaR
MDNDDVESRMVLVVEDEPLIRDTVTEAFESAGLEVLSAANAQEALDALRGHPEVSVVFTDINMPGTMDGLDLARFVRGKWPRIALIVTSGRPPPSGEMPGRFFSKPYNLGELIEAIKASRG